MIKPKENLAACYTRAYKYFLRRSVTAKTVLANKKLWSGLYNITIEILRALTIKLTQARDRAMARTTDRPRLKARAMVSSRARARARAWECVYV